MNKSSADNMSGTYVKIPQIAEDCNLGIATVRKIASKAGAVRKFGRCVRVNREQFLQFIEEHNDCMSALSKTSQDKQGE